MAYSYDQVFAADPANPQNVAANASILIYAPGDATKTPLTITDPSGSPLSNPVTVNANGFGSAFMHATLDRVAWDGGGFSGFFTSYEGMKNEAVDARTAAESAAATAGADAAAVAEAAIAGATDEATAAAASAATAASNAASSATAAANAAALVGAPADSAIAAAVSGSATATKAALNATFASQFTATGMTTAADVNAWLAVPYNGPKRLVGALSISAPLVIKSGTHLDASGATITSSHSGNMIQNEKYASTTSRDSNITITGGTWQRNAGGPAGGSGNGWANGAHSIFMRHVDKLTIRNLRVGSTGGKYMVALGDVTDFHVADIHAEAVASDTVHMTGPCSQGVVERVRVASGGDDCVAFTTTDYISYDDVHGPFSNVTVRDVTANNTTRTVLVAGSASGADDGFGLSSIVVENVKQLGTGAGVWVGGGYSTAKLTDLTMRNVAGTINLRHKSMGVIVAENCGGVIVAPDVTNTPTAIDRLIIREPRAAANLFQMSNAAITVEQLEIAGAVFAGASHAVMNTGGTIKQAILRSTKFNGAYSLIYTSGAINQVTIDGLTGTVAATQPLIAIQTATGVVGTINASNLAYTAADTSSGQLVSLDSTGKLATLNVTGGLYTAIKNLLAVASGASGSMAVNLVNVSTTGLNRLVEAGGVTIDLTYSNVNAASMINQPFRVFGGGVLNVRGSGFRGYTASSIVRAASEAIRVVAPDLPVDVSILAKNNGDTAFNTNSFAAPVGVVMSDGSKWAAKQDAASTVAENLAAARVAALRPARAGLANRDFARCDMMIWGTSMTEGGPGVAASAGPSNRWRRWLDRLQVNLRARFPLTQPVTGSLGYIPAFFQTFFAGGTSANGRVTPEGVTYSGNLTAYGSGLGSRSLGLATAADWIQFTFTGDAFDLFLSTHTTASTVALITIDGVAEPLYTLSASTLTPTRFTKTGLTIGSHTVKVAFDASSPGPVVVDGLKPYNGDIAKGIHVWDAGRGSAKITDVGTVSSFRGFKQMGIIQPSLVGVEWGYNEFFGNIDVATFKTNLTSFVSACQANLTANPPTYVFIIWPEPKHPSTPVAPYSDYVQAIRDVAGTTTNGVVLDFGERIPKYTTDPAGFFYSDQVHWSDKGSAYVADVIAEVIASK